MYFHYFYVSIYLRHAGIWPPEIWPIEIWPIDIFWIPNLNNVEALWKFNGKAYYRQNIFEIVHQPALSGAGKLHRQVLSHVHGCACYTIFAIAFKVV